MSVLAQALERLRPVLGIAPQFIERPCPALEMGPLGYWLRVACLKVST